MYDDVIFKQFWGLLHNCTTTVVLRKQLVILRAHRLDPVEREDTKIPCRSYIKMIISFMDKRFCETLRYPGMCRAIRRIVF